MNIIPQPEKVIMLNGKFNLPKNAKIYAAPQFKKTAQLFSALVEKSICQKLTLCDDLADASVCFVAPADGTHITVQGYFIACANNMLSVYAATEQGAFYAIQTLRQVFEMDGVHESLTCDNFEIHDNPKFLFRSVSFDVARHFFGKEVIENLISRMASLKLNKLHLHLADDQGYRLESEAFPLLNTISSVRSGSEVRRGGKSEVDDVVVSGYLTKADVAELVAFAAERFIEIIPEIDLPGHCVAMLAAYPQFGCSGEGYEVRKRWGVSKDLLCGGNDEAYAFAETLVDEVAEMFPSKYFHLGGDEAPKERWHNCKKCQQKISELHLADENALQSYFTNRLAEHLEHKGKKIICWNDGVNASTKTDIICEHWTGAASKNTMSFVKRGGKVIVSEFWHFYFDYPYSMTSTHKVYSFNPLFCALKRNAENVLGTECCIWTEHIVDEYKLWFNVFPRLWAYAENAWGTNKSFSSFTKRAKRLEAVYAEKGFVFARGMLKKRGGIAAFAALSFFGDTQREVDKQRAKDNE